jgi:hypothetical protein
MVERRVRAGARPTLMIEKRQAQMGDSTKTLMTKPEVSVKMRSWRGRRGEAQDNGTAI